jgi:hypothetical protein
MKILDKTLTRILLAGGLLAGSAIADDTAPRARNYGTLNAAVKVADKIGASDRSDWFRFRTSRSGTVQVRLDQLRADADLYVMASNGRRYWMQTRGTGAERFARSLPAGQHYVMVYGLPQSTNYRLTVAPPNVSLDTVPTGQRRNLGAIDGMGGLNRTKVANGRISAGDGYLDYWFSIPDTRSVDVMVNIPGSLGALMDARTRNLGVTRNGRLKRQLAAGRYFVRLFPNQTRGSLPFSMSVSASVPNTNDRAGNRPNLARNLGTPRPQPMRVQDYVGRYDHDDWYRINVRTNQRLTLNLTQSGQDADLHLTDANGRTISRSARNGRSNESIAYNTRLNGTMLIRVAIKGRTPRANQHSRYTLTVAMAPHAPLRRPPVIRTAPPRNPDTSNSMQTARSIFVSGNPFQWSERVGDAGDPQDWFTFTVGANLGSIKRRGGTVELSGLSANADVEIYDQRGQRIAVPTRSGTQREFFGFTFDVGKRYYLRVISRGGGTNYQLRIALR